MNIQSWLRLLIIPYHLLNRVLPQSGIIYEIGCGWGTLAAEIARFSSKRLVIGIDINQKKIIQGKKIYKSNNLKLVNANAIVYPYKKCRAVVLSDFLHHINYSNQNILLLKLSKISQIIIIKEIDQDDGILKIFSRLWDYFLYPKDKIYYRRKKELKNHLIKLGYKITIIRAKVWFPGSTHLYICKKN